MNRTACFLAIATLLGASAHAADPSASLTRTFTEYAGTGPVGDGSINDNTHFYWMFESTGIWSGQAVNSWYLIWEPLDRLTVSGTITFDAPILFFQDDKSELVATAAFGKPGVSYSYASGLVGLETPDKNNTSWSGSTLTLAGSGWNAGSSGDHVRVMTAVNPVPEPGTYALMLGGLGVVGLLARRRRAA